MEQQIIVLGMHRSGTSMLSKLLINLGVDMGDGNHVGSISNVDGHNEDTEMRVINEAILSTLKSTWDDPPKKEDIAHIEDFICKQYTEFVDKRGGLWGVKDPRLSLFASELDKVLTNPKYIFILRNEDSVAKSLNVRDGMSIDKAKKLKCKYDEYIVDFLSNKSHLKIQYEDLIDSPTQVLFSICKFLEIKVRKEAISHIRNQTDLEELKKQKLYLSLKNALFSVCKDPKKIFRKNTFTFIKANLRRIKELYL
ncbi:sulfotransferase [Paraglaciecola arctica]|uniref:sulfotransferase n=1 Tax=Paraglaciecola arctica TaxID=1128911 RepID=UPI001C07E6BC|nr:sulfotransferase [Paraglaciecola arctica]MBU3004206.1 sulfotransferase [Paraglaciecola arctica]